MQPVENATGAEDPLVGERLGSYAVESLIGRGAFASVYRARQLSLGRSVALKVLDPVVAREPLLARRFSDEARRAGELDHPCIVPVYDAGEDAGRSFLAMRLVEGWTLTDELGKGPLSPSRLLEITACLCAALDHAHSRGVVHRDVKPDNVLLEPGRVWLADFGIAATTMTAGLYTAGPIGTGQYMAPEQAQPGPIDGRADLYALGCVIYRCLTGVPPFPGTDLATLLVAHASEPVPGTGAIALDTFMIRAMAKDPAQRFASGAEMLGSLQEALEGRRVAAPPAVSAPQQVPNRPPPPRPRRRWWRR
ncbi:MAG TPA: serine/threonine-protein kinase [Acidimicrobiales bacterium]|nr:serine/threonine-protein kinase [Acidimicrobiales bacterium]